MTNRLWLLVMAVAIVGLAIPADAVTWKKFGTTQVATSMTPGSSAIYDFVNADSTGWGPIIQAGDCQMVTAQFDPNLDGTAGNGRVQLYSCIDIPTTKLGTDNVCGKVLVDTDGDGLLNDVPMAGGDGSSGAAVTRYIFDITGIPFIAPNVTTPADGVTRARLLLTCVPY